MTGDASATARNWRRGIWAVFALHVLGMLCLRLADIAAWPVLSAPLGPANPDAWLRLAQLRDWLTGGGFYSHAVARTNAPLGDIQIHWTRPLDFVLATLYALTPQNWSVDFRLLVAGSFYPALLCGAAAGLMNAGAKRIFRHNHALACTLLLFSIAPYMRAYFSPGDTDHHGLMSVLWCGIVVLLLDLRRLPATSLAIGALLGTIIWISPEGLLLFLTLIAITGVETLRRASHAEKFSMFYIAAGAAAVATIAVCIEVPSGQIFSHVTYDAISIVHPFFLWLAAATCFIFCAACRASDSLLTRVATGGAAGFIALLVLHHVYPKFLLGPFADADPYIFQNFLPFVNEARPLLSFNFTQYAPSLVQPALALLLAAMALFGKRRRGLRWRRVRLLTILMTVMLGLTLLQTRWAYYLAPIALMLCAALLPLLAVGARKFAFAPRRWQPYLWMVFIFAYMTGTTLASAKLAEGRPGSGCMNEARYVIQTQQLQKLLQPDTDTVIYTYEDLGGEMLFFTPYRIIASNYHREAEGLRDLRDLREAADADTFHALLQKRKVGALLVCPLYHPTVFVAGKPEPAYLKKIGGLEFYQPVGNKPVLYRMTD